jgi:chromatin remodeling complex protein RSC6
MAKTAGKNKETGDASPPKGKKVAKPKPGSKPNALQQPLQPSAELAAIVGSGTLARGEVVSKVWEYIKAHKLQSPDDGRQIVADVKLEKVFGKKTVTMFEMNKLLSNHLKSPA